MSRQADESESESPATSLIIASFSIISTKVKLTVRNNHILLHKDNVLGLTYHFRSSNDTEYYWKQDGILAGHYNLVDDQGAVVTRYKNKRPSTAEVGTFEILGEVHEKVIEEILISGLSVLVMCQSLKLGCLVLRPW